MKNIIRVFVCGWYGTETLGDRAILAGIIKILNNTFGESKIIIGSLYPFLTKRTLIEDIDIYKNIGPEVSIEYIDVNNIKHLNSTIETSDIIIFGGGPIMDLLELEIIRYIFIRAKKINKKTVIMGCGMGPLYKKQFKKTAADILKHSDLTIFRDKNSVYTAHEIYKKEEDKYTYSHDPAILAVGEYIFNHPQKQADSTIAINLRYFQNIGFDTMEYLEEQKLLKMLEIISYYFKRVVLVPMHTFGIGGDDRLYLTKIRNKIKNDNIEIIHKPLNLYQLFKLFADSSACVGMRYHSIVFQTLLNGNNYILDYTELNKGKISSFLSLIDKNEFYKNRYINVLRNSEDKLLDSIPVTINNEKKFVYDNRIFNDTLNYYSDKISALF